MKIEHVKINRWYLEMKKAPATKIKPVPADVVIKKFGRLTCDEYRKLNKIAGEGVMWVDRQIMSDEALSAIIHDPATEIFGLYQGDAWAGFAEISKTENEYELHYFGLLTPFRGKGLANYFLQWIIQYAWSQQPAVFKLNTCEYDSEHALSFYQKNGFEVVDQRVEDQAVFL